MAIAIGIGSALVFLAAYVGLRLTVRWGNWWFWYERYGQSNRWATLAEQVKRRDRYTCRECGYKAARYATHHGIIKWREPLQAHHLPGTYRKWWAYALCLPEWKRNLITLCVQCHRAAHGRPTDA